MNSQYMSGIILYIILYIIPIGCHYKKLLWGMMVALLLLKSGPEGSRMLPCSRFCWRKIDDREGRGGKEHEQLEKCGISNQDILSQLVSLERFKTKCLKAPLVYNELISLLEWQWCNAYVPSAELIK